MMTTSVTLKSRKRAKSDPELEKQNCCTALVMKLNKTISICLFILGISVSPCLASGDDDRPQFNRTLGVGVAYMGGLFRWGFKKHWSLEGHALFGSADSNDGNVSSMVMGARGYRHFRTDRRLQLFAGVEADYVTAKSQNLKSSGYLAGAFGGVEYYILPRLSIGLDLGPYYLSLKEKDLAVSESGLDFILNTFLNFYIF